MAENTLRSLSKRQAQNCEEAKEPVCKCRCGGSKHGAKRNGDQPADLAFFNSLPEDDPHHLDTPAQKREKANARKREETRLKNERIAAAWAKLYEKPVSDPLGC